MVVFSLVLLALTMVVNVYFEYQGFSLWKNMSDKKSRFVFGWILIFFGFCAFDSILVFLTAFIHGVNLYLQHLAN